MWEGREAEVGRAADAAAMAPVLLTRITIELTELVREALRSDLTSNRELQLVVGVGLNPGLTSSRMAELFGLSRSAFSQLLRKGLDAGLITREVSASDHRSVRLYLSRLGEERVHALESAVHDWTSARLAMLVELTTTLGGANRAVPGPPTSVMEVLGAMAAAGSRYIEAATARVAPRGVTDFNERSVLGLLAAYGPTRPNHLARALELTTGGCSRIVDRLSGLGLVVRIADVLADDKRAVAVQLTPDGEQVAGELAAALNETGKPIGDALSALVAIADSVAVR
ncbi:MAG: MarR family transcriptional regulator [Propionibacteriaceae bacterium]|nr:MarR family transcriptional regulator [Propionibacteriaceae bacterium]